ncbi:hypothetical protein PoB_001407100 [Plakobranchus ocellatus]|uniref:Uncharacterized protein n=1 Tax=Plakobranchus ocellatus TaxID=259542 RepID=A0AAV3YYY4_9GAST|nr:hypothetical protein PoB_001407100 [Plakobranchus ocellatus]
MVLDSEEESRVQEQCRKILNFNNCFNCTNSGQTLRHRLRTSLKLTFLMHQNESHTLEYSAFSLISSSRKASLTIYPAIGGTVNRKFASDVKGVFCHGFALQQYCPGLMEGLKT